MLPGQFTGCLDGIIQTVAKNKNHLLILKQQGNSAETAQTIEKLQAQIIQYEDYVHTGNDILDIILKEKSRQARETQIDFL